MPPLSGFPARDGHRRLFDLLLQLVRLGDPNPDQSTKNAVDTLALRMCGS